jgi:hypothetical protein
VIPGTIEASWSMGALIHRAGPAPEAVRTVYRAERVRAFFFLLLGGSFVASGGHAILGLGVRWPFVLTCLLGAFCIGAAVCILLTRVAVDGRGLHRRAPFDGSFRASWDEVESWWVQRANVRDETLPGACFRLCGQRERVVVYAVDVSRPGFQAFLGDVRARVGDRETADPDAADG